MHRNRHPQSALTLKTSETVVFGSSDNDTGTSTRLKNKVDFRIEPSDKEGFLAALAAARKSARTRDHFFADEMPAIPASPSALPDDDSAAAAQGVSYVPGHSCSYWARYIYILAFYWAGKCVCDASFPLLSLRSPDVVPRGREHREETRRET